MKAYAVVLDDKNAPHGFWYVGIYHDQESAEAAKGKQQTGCRVIEVQEITERARVAKLEARIEELEWKLYCQK